MRRKVFKSIWVVINTIISLFIMYFIASLMFYLGYYISNRNHGKVSVSDICLYTETADYVDNPNRGFYYIYGFFISDDSDIDYMTDVHSKMSNTENMSLAMVQINLQNYNKGPISEKGLNNIKELFEALDSMDRQYLLRFLYDWDGENEKVEPQDVEIILTHISQLEPIFKEYGDIIFVHQGLFIGNWGEMNGTKHLEHMGTLAYAIRHVMQEDTFLGVRMPMQWRIVTQTSNPNKESWEPNNIASYLSLYNDGMLGSYSDYGTYGPGSRDENGEFSYWNRTEELVFQDELCKYVPNGGEVIVENSFNDFENALKDMRTMHITYLNLDYDKEVLNKWERYRVQEEGCFKGMDGLTYIERHMGYRIVLKESVLAYNLYQDNLNAKLTLQNVGFAPIYKEATLNLVLLNKTTGEKIQFISEQDIRTLHGGNASHELLEVVFSISLNGYGPGEYQLFFFIEDINSGKMLQLAIEEERQEEGYYIGEIIVEPLINPITKKEVKIDNKEELFGGIFFGE